MLAEQLKQEIDSYYEKARNYNPLYQQAREGRLTAYQLARFAKTAEYLVVNTPIHLNLARQLAIQANEMELASFFTQKIRDEQGHDQWAKEDVSELQKAFQLSQDIPIAPSVVAMVEYIESRIRQDVFFYLPYIFLAEYYTCIMGTPWLSDIERNCSIPANYLSIVGNHVILDKEHVQDDIREINALIKNPDYYRPKFLEILRDGEEFYDRIYAEIA